VQLAEFEFHLGATQTGAPVATNPGGRNPGAETPPKAVDGDIDTKWLDFNKGPLVFDFGAPESIDSYRWATANDVPDRDPVRWTLEGGDDGLNWTLLDDRTGADYPTPASRHTFTPALALNQLPDTPSIQFTATDGTVTSDTAIAVPGGTQITLHWDVAESTGVTLDTGAPRSRSRQPEAPRTLRPRPSPIRWWPPMRRGAPPPQSPSLWIRPCFLR
jgi:hypothetical protein